MSTPQNPNQAYNPTASADSEDRMWMVLAHLSAPIAAIVSAGWLSMVGPLVIYMVAKDRPKVRQAAAGAFNFNLSFWVMYVIGWILLFTVIGLPVAIIIWACIFVVSFFAHLTGTMRALGGKSFTYPFQIRVLR